MTLVENIETADVMVLALDGFVFHDTYSARAETFTPMKISEIRPYINEFPEYSSVVLPPMVFDGYVLFLKFLEEAKKDIYILTSDVSSIPPPIRSRAVSKIGSTEIKRLHKLRSIVRSHNILAFLDSLGKIIFMKFHYKDLDVVDFIDYLNLCTLELNPALAYKYKKIVDFLSVSPYGSTRSKFETLVALSIDSDMIKQNLKERL